MLTLSHSTYSIDLSKYIEKHSIDILPAFEFTESLSGKLFKKYDYGTSIDKSYTDILLNLPFSVFQDFQTFHKNTKGNVLTLSTDIDLFVPNVIPTSAIITSITDKGYLSDIRTGIRSIEIRLFCPSGVGVSAQSYPSSIFDSSIWTQTITRSDYFKTYQSSQTFEYDSFDNDEKSWTVAIDYLSKSDSNTLLNYLLTIRTSSTSITLSGKNSNSTSDISINVVFESFKIESSGLYYNWTLTVREV